MKKGEFGPLMYLLLAVVLLLAIVGVLLVLRGKGLSIVDLIRSKL
jgi:hypothetical protein